MKISTVASALLTSTTVHGTTAFLPSQQVGRRVFGLHMSSTDSREGVKKTTLNAADLASNQQLINVLSDPAFQGPIHEAEEEVSGSMMLGLVRSCVAWMDGWMDARLTV